MKTDNTKTMPNTKTTTGNKTTEEGYRMPGNKTADKWTSPAQTEFHCFFVDQLKRSEEHTSELQSPWN